MRGVRVTNVLAAMTRGHNEDASCMYWERYVAYRDDVIGAGEAGKSWSWTKLYSRFCGSPTPIQVADIVERMMFRKAF